MFLVAVPAVDWATLCRLERHFGFSAAFRTGYFVHSPTAHSILTHNTLTPLLGLVTRKIYLEVKSAAYQPDKVSDYVIKAILHGPYQTC